MTGRIDHRRSVSTSCPGNETTTIQVAGEIDLATAPDLHARLRTLVETTSGDLTLDMSRVTFLDSTALHVIATTHRRLGEARRRLNVSSPSRRVRRLLEVSGMARLLEVATRPPVAQTRR